MVEQVTRFFPQLPIVGSNQSPDKAKGAFVSEKRPSYLDGDKPNSVVDDHLSKRHTRGLNRTGCPPSVLSCTAWGLSCRLAYAKPGELLPRLFTLTRASFKVPALSFL